MPDEEVTPEAEKEEGWLQNTFDSVTGHVSAYGAGIWTFVWSTLTDWIPSILGTVWDVIESIFERVLGAIKESLLVWIKGFTDVDDEMETEIGKLWDLPFPIDLFCILSALVFTPILYLKERLRLAMLGHAHEAAEKTQSDIPPLETVLREWFRSPDDRIQLTEYLNQHNFGGIALDTLVKATRNFGDVQTILTMRNRELIATDTAAQDYIQKLGFEDVDAQRILELRNTIPPVQDIIRMAVREAFSETAIEAFDLDADYPDLLTAWGAKQGLSKEWCENYWRAHWVLPSVGQGYEMMWRTDFSEDDLDLLMRTADISPYFRPYLKEIAYHPYTRVDVRRMYDLGVLKESELLQAYKDLGFDAEKAANMVKFTIRYTNKTETKTDVDNQLWGAEHGFQSFDDAEVNIAVLLDDEDEAKIIVSRVHSNYAIGVAKKKEARIKRLYVQKRIDLGNASDQLDEIGILADAKADLLADWDEERKAKDRYPSKADIVKYIGLGVIEPWEFREEMERMGFDIKYIEWEALSLGIKIEDLGYSEGL